MRRVHVLAKGGAYPILIGSYESALRKLIQNTVPAVVVVVTDTRVERIHGKAIRAALGRGTFTVEIISFRGGEERKNQATVTTLQHALLKCRAGRDTLIVAIGGGVVGDVAGFVAATYLRGVPYIHVPTTILAMVDSAIGGKVGVNTPYGKNTVGAFWPPKAVLIDPAFLETLSREEIVNGLFEAVKTFFTSDANALARFEQLDLTAPLGNPALLKRIIADSVAIKTGIVGRDEREAGERKVINFGHTIGHAIELLSHFKLPHGTAVGYGMLVESKVAQLLGILSGRDFERVREILETMGIRTAYLRHFKVPALLSATRSDKKTIRGVPQYVLLSALGSVYVRDGRYAHPVPDAIVRRAIKALLQ